MRRDHARAPALAPTVLPARPRPRPRPAAQALRVVYAPATAAALGDADAAHMAARPAAAQRPRGRRRAPASVELPGFSPPRGAEAARRAPAAAPPRAHDAAAAAGGADRGPPPGWVRVNAGARPGRAGRSKPPGGALMGRLRAPPPALTAPSSDSALTPPSPRPPADGEEVEAAPADADEYVAEAADAAAFDDEEWV
jgi:hypothetical protein